MTRKIIRTRREDLPSAEEFEEMVKPLLDRLFAVGRRLTGNEKDAEDLLQDTLLRAYRNMEKFELGTNLGAWMVKIETNLFRNAYRQKKIRPGRTDFEIAEAFHEEARCHESPDRLPTEELLDDEVLRALQEIPPEFRAVVDLAVFEGFSYAEIAEAIGCPIGTVMSRLFRGRRLLREKLREYAERTGMQIES
ncbi:MAG: sigma-70 family RNA polymerase sigma factor [Planctomycetota bacterium]